MQNEELIKNILSAMPEKMDGGDIVDVIINMIECYGMREDWIMIAVCVGHALNEINQIEAEKESATHH